jgi:capsular polysaccharide biosynthesis protein
MAGARDYAMVLVRRWWLIGLIAFLAAAAAYGVSKLQTPLFRARATYDVITSRWDQGLINQLPNVMNNWSGQLTDIRLQTISDQLQLDRSPDYLRKYVHIQPQPNNLLLIIDVDYPDAQTAVDLANAIGETLKRDIADLNNLRLSTDAINIRVQQPAKFLELASPKTKINVLAGGILGLVIGVLVAFMLEYLDDTLKTSADVERWTGLPTLGTIPASEL